MSVSWIGNGTFASGSGSVVPGLPTGWAVGDSLFLVVSTANQYAALTVTAGWNIVYTANNGGTPGAAGAIDVTIYRKRAAAGEVAPTISGTTSYKTAQIHLIRGTVGQNFAVKIGGMGTSTAFPATTLPGPFPAGLLFQVVGLDRDSGSTNEVSGWGTVNGVVPTERHDQIINTGSGGGFAVATTELPAGTSQIGTAGSAANTITLVTAQSVLTVQLYLTEASATSAGGPYFIDAPAHTSDFSSTQAASYYTNPTLSGDGLFGFIRNDALGITSYSYNQATNSWSTDSARSAFTKPNTSYTSIHGLAVNEDATIAAICYYLSSTQAYVHIFDWSGTAWVARAGSLALTNPSVSSSIRRITLSRDGGVVACGWVQNSTPSTTTANVAVYAINGSTFTQIGATINSPGGTAAYGFVSPALSYNGTTLFVGAYGYDGAAGTDQGGVYVYDWTGAAWVQRGDVLTPPDAAPGDQFGYSVACTGNGRTLIVGAPTVDVDWADAGAFYTFAWDGSAWVQPYGRKVGRLSTYTRTGDGVSISTDGTRLWASMRLVYPDTTRVRTYVSPAASVTFVPNPSGVNTTFPYLSEGAVILLGQGIYAETIQPPAHLGGAGLRVFVTVGGAAIPASQVTIRWDAGAVTVDAVLVGQVLTLTGAAMLVDATTQDGQTTNIFTGAVTSSTPGSNQTRISGTSTAVTRKGDWIFDALMYRSNTRARVPVDWAVRPGQMFNGQRITAVASTAGSGSPWFTEVEF